MVIVESLVPAVVATGVVVGWIARRPRPRPDPGPPLHQQPGIRVLTQPDDLDRALARAVHYDDVAAQRMMRHLDRYEQMTSSGRGRRDPGRTVG